MKLDPIIAVKNLAKSADWYQQLFGFKRQHGGNHFAVLVDHKDQVVLCLHAWKTDDHPTMRNPEITPGNGLILYFKTPDLNKIREKAQKMNCPLEVDLHQNPNSLQNEFSLRDPDGYFLIVTSYHEYEG